MLGDCGVCSRQDSPRVVLGTPGDLYLGPSQCWGYPGRWVVCAVISCPFPVLRLLWNPLPQAMWADSWLQVSPWTPGWSGNSWSHFSMAGTPGWVRTDDGARLWSGGLSKCLILTQKMALPRELHVEATSISGLRTCCALLASESWHCPNPLPALLDSSSGAPRLLRVAPVPCLPASPRLSSEDPASFRCWVCLRPPPPLVQPRRLRGPGASLCFGGGAWGTRNPAVLSLVYFLPWPCMACLF